MAHEGWNQNPPSFAADTTTRQDLNGTSNSTAHRDHRDDIASLQIDPGTLQESEMPKSDQVSHRSTKLDESFINIYKHKVEFSSLHEEPSVPTSPSPVVSLNGRRFYQRLSKMITGLKHAVIKYGQFIGPGFMIAVAYIDP